MEKGTIVKIRFKRFFKEQRLWVFVGKVLESKDGWVKIHGKGILFNPGKTDPIDIDDQARTLYCPKDSINYVRVLPDNFDITQIETCRRGHRWFIKVPKGPDTSLGEGT